MCGRFSETADKKQIVKELGIPEKMISGKIVPRHNIAPGMPVLVLSGGAQRTAAYMKWGLVPVWAKDPSIGNRMINARAETVHEKPSFRGPFKNSRCLIPATGFYEWKKESKSKTPYHIRMKSKEVFTFAGLWSHWTGPEGSELLTCTILTTEPNPLMSPIHNRMPVIISPDDRETWLDTSRFEKERLLKLLSPCDDALMEAYPVSTYVNSPRNDGPECLQPLAN